MPTPIDPQTHPGVVALTVADLDRSLVFYTGQIGLTVRAQATGSAILGTPERDLLRLHELPGARHVRGVSGLYHFALLVPDRLELGRTLRHLIATGTHFTGFADHAVSEAIYLPDPDGHGIEIYRDRPRDQWEYPNGQLKLVTKPFDAEGVLGTLDGSTPPWDGIAPRTVMGHVHLHVADQAAADAFYLNVLGFDLIARMPGASFASAGGYHHHLGFNTWAGPGAPPPPDDAARLLWYEILLPDEEALQAVTARITAAGLPLDDHDGGQLVRDPAGDGIMLRAA